VSYRAGHPGLLLSALGRLVGSVAVTRPPTRPDARSRKAVRQDGLPYRTSRDGGPLNEASDDGVARCAGRRSGARMSRTASHGTMPFRGLAGGCLVHRGRVYASGLLG
jgi:hypothetical protein